MKLNKRYHFKRAVAVLALAIVPLGLHFLVSTAKRTSVPPIAQVPRADAPESPREPSGNGQPAQNPTRIQPSTAPGAVTANSGLAAAPAQQQTAMQNLPKTEQESFWAAFNTARRAVTPLSEHEAAMPQNKDVRFFAFNPGQKLTARFLDGAIRIGSARGSEWKGTLRFAGLDGETTSTSSPGAQKERVEYQHPGGVTEWYLNRADGIEHGFTVANRPADAAASGELELNMHLEGLRAESAEGGVQFVDEATDRPVLGYGGLKVWDANGKTLAARLEPRGSRLAILVADDTARYPVIIDPLIVSLEAKIGPEITGDGGVGDTFGINVALSGETAVVGAYQDDTAAGFRAGSAYVFVRSGTAWTQQAKLTPGDGRAVDFFGFSVALSGETALIGAYEDDTSAGVNAGSAYVFVRSGATWSQQAKLTAADSAAVDFFGFSVALSGETALIGAYQDDTSAGLNAGSAYVFVRSGTVWTQQAKLISGDASASDFFGVSVALSGETALVGASLDDTSAGPNAGSAYVFVRNGTAWSQQARLSADDDGPEDQFGISVALSGETALVGASFDDTSAGFNAGSAYVFVRNGTAWSEEARLTADDSAASDSFGRSVAVSGGTALVGAPGDDTSAGANVGSACVFVRSGTAWIQQTRLTADDGAVGDIFGVSVAISGETALVGASQDDTPAGAAAGSAYVFVRGGTAWTQEAKLSLGESAEGDFFGHSVAILGETALVGSSRDATAAGMDAGSAYVFVRVGTAWSQEAKLTAGDGAASDFFGISVAISGETALVGAFAQDTSAGVNAGSAYVFVRAGTAWSQQAKLSADDSAAGDSFGISVAISDETALVGAMRDDTAAGTDAGSAYLFVRSGTAWTQQAKLSADDAAAGDLFGNPVAISGETALLGASQDDTSAGANAGSAYVFVRGGTAWSQEAKLSADDGAAGDAFGNSVAISGETALVGAVQDDTPAGVNAGSAYVFVRGGTAWSQEAKLGAGDGAAGDFFGHSVAIFGETALVGASRDATAAGVNAGSAYVFVRGGTAWSQEAKLSADDGAAGDSFGNSVAVFGETAVVGASQDDSTDPELRLDHGSAYIFRLSSDATPPMITLHGANPMSLECAAEYVELGAIVTDDTDPNPTLVITGSVNAQLPGSYTITYTATDASGKSSSVTRTVVVVAPIPLLNAIDPVSTVANGPDLVLHLSGSCFVPGAVIRWNASAYPAVFENSTTLAVTIPASEFATSADLLLVNVSVENPGGYLSNPQVFVVTNPSMGELQSGLALAGESVSVSTAPVAAGEAGLVAVANNTGGEPLLIAGGTYEDTPPSGLVFGSGGIYYDLVVFGADAGDAAAVSFYYPSSVAGADENRLRLTWFNGTSWIPVKGSGNSSPEKDTTDNQHNTISGGRFTVTLDSTSSPKLTELSGTVFALANTEPLVTVTGSVAPMAVNTPATVGISYDAIGTPDTQIIAVTWGDGSQSLALPAEFGETSATHTYTTAGVYTVVVTVTDANGDSGIAEFRYVVVYDPSAGFVTGGGWISSPLGACMADPNLSGKANFGFVAKYKNGANVPEGNTEFQFKAGNLNFKSTAYEWLVVSGARAQYKGAGTINGQGSYDFKLTAIDGQAHGGGGSDRLRMKIWDHATGALVYDNQLDASDDAALPDSTIIGGGSIVLHKQ